jgi:RNA polymerase sigma-70 factor (ECF subfamily)
MVERAHHSTAALDHLLGVIHPHVLRWLRHRVRQRYDLCADDLTQDVLFAVARALPRYRDTGQPFEAWIFTVTRNRLADAYRGAARRIYSIPVGDYGDLDDRRWTSTATDSPEQAVLDTDTSDLEHLLRTLTPREREVIVLRTLWGLSIDETAAVMGLGRATVKARHSGALRRLRNTLPLATSPPRDATAGGGAR